jgi:hypothetical protein
MKKEKVYCKDCSYFKEIEHFIFVDFICTDKHSITLNDCIYSFYDRAFTRTSNQPADKNKNNNCTWYKEKK